MTRWGPEERKKYGQPRSIIDSQHDQVGRPRWDLSGCPEELLHHLDTDDEYLGDCADMPHGYHFA